MYMNDSDKEMVVATMANQMFGNLTLSQAMEIIQGATIQAAQGEYDRMPADKKEEILAQGAAWKEQINEQFKQQQEDQVESDEEA